MLRSYTAHRTAFDRSNARWTAPARSRRERSSEQEGHRGETSAATTIPGIATSDQPITAFNSAATVGSVSFMEPLPPLLMTPKARYFWPLVLAVFLTDCTTKDLAVNHLIVAVPQDLLDSILRLTLVHNPGTAFGIDLRPYLGESARVVLIVMMLTVLATMLAVYWRTAPRARLLGAAMGLVCGGAAGMSLIVYDSHSVWSISLTWASAGIASGFSMLQTSPLRSALRSSRSFYCAMTMTNCRRATSLLNMASDPIILETCLLQTSSVRARNCHQAGTQTQCTQLKEILSHAH